MTEPTESWPKSEQMEARRRGDNLEVKSMRHCKHLGCFSFEKWLGQTLFFRRPSSRCSALWNPRKWSVAHPHTLTSQSAALKQKSPSSKQKVAYTRPLCCPYETLLLREVDEWNQRHCLLCSCFSVQISSFQCSENDPEKTPRYWECKVENVHHNNSFLSNRKSSPWPSLKFCSV